MGTLLILQHTDGIILIKKHSRCLHHTWTIVLAKLVNTTEFFQILEVRDPSYCVFERQLTEQSERGSSVNALEIINE